MQVSNFGGTFDQLFPWIFYEIFTEDASLLLLYHGAKKSKVTKISNQGVPLSPLSSLFSFSSFNVNILHLHVKLQIAIDRNGFGKTKEEGQIYKILPYFFLSFSPGLSYGLSKFRRWRKRERARAGIEPTAAAPSQPDCPGVSCSDHSAGSKESASWRALELRSDWHGRLGVGRREKEGKETSGRGSQDEAAQDKEENGSWTNSAKT